MTSWLLGIIGVIFLGVLLDIMYPNGKTNVFCKGVFGLFAVVVLITPIIKLPSQTASFPRKCRKKPHFMQLFYHKSSLVSMMICADWHLITEKEASFACFLFFFKFQLLPYRVCGRIQRSRVCRHQAPSRREIRKGNRSCDRAHRRES